MDHAEQNRLRARVRRLAEKIEKRDLGGAKVRVSGKGGVAVAVSVDDEIGDAVLAKGTWDEVERALRAMLATMPKAVKEDQSRTRAEEALARDQLDRWHTAREPSRRKSAPVLAGYFWLPPSSSLGRESDPVSLEPATGVVDIKLGLQKGYDRGGAFWGKGPVRVRFARDGSFAHYYRGPKIQGRLDGKEEIMRKPRGA